MRRIGRRKLRRGLQAFAAATAAVAFAAPASASYKAVCTFDTDAKIYDKDDPSMGLRLVGGEGKFTFVSFAVVCVGDSNKDLAPEVDVLDLSATGWYSSTVCGTGKLLGTIDDIRGADTRKTEVLLEGRKFGIELVERSGIFKWHGPTAKPDLAFDKEDPVSDDKENPGGDKDYSEAGYVRLAEANEKVTPPELAAGECMKAFSVAGSFLVHFDS